MQKKLIALAVAGLASTAAFAQSNVTVYGVADIGFVSTSQGGVKQNRIDSGLMSGSRLGFKGVEDLGNGLKALFTLEYGLDIDQNTGVGAGTAVQARQQFLGLTGGFGTVVAGRLQTPGYNAAVKFDSMAATAFSAHRALAASGLLGAATGPMQTGTINASSRLNNAVAYVSPNFSGVTVTGAYSAAGASGETTTGTNGARDSQEKIYALSADYDNGPLALNATWHGVRDYNNTAVGAAAINTNEYFLGGSYDFGVAKAFATYQWDKQNNAASGVTDKLWQLGVAVPVGAAGSVRAAYAQFRDGDAATNTDAKAYTVAYLHSLSKRTTAYVGYTHLSNESGVNYSTIGGSNNAGAATLGAGANLFAFGMNHSF